MPDSVNDDNTSSNNARDGCLFDTRQILHLNSESEDFESRLSGLLQFDTGTNQQISHDVEQIIDEVKRQGDSALIKYTERFDKRQLKSMDDLLVSQEAMQNALDGLNIQQRQALEYAAKRIESYHQHQLQRSWEYTDELGNRLGQQVTALDRVGIYVPGGKAAYPSSVLMNTIPAKVAGVNTLVMVSPAPIGELNDLVLAAAALVGVNQFFSIGGAQAIAALAYGTETILKVDKIVGPGNAYVAAAKQKVYGQVGIDMLAGPSEILIIADAGINPDWLAMDLCSQAEHDENAQAILLTTDHKVISAVANSLEKLVPTLPRADIVAASLQKRGALIALQNQQQVIDLTNRIAPEHLQLSVADAENILPSITNAGAIFVGYNSVEALGDYCAGPSHVLPTSATARFASPLGVYDFQKRTSIINCSAAGAAHLASTAGILARGEQLMAHAFSAEYRRP